MVVLSRRALVSGVVAVSVGSGVAGPVTDPISAQAAEWISEHRARAAMIARWADLETILFAKCKAANLSCSGSSRSGFAEAQTMRSLDRQIKRTGNRLDRKAGLIANRDAVTPLGALAQIQLGLVVQGPYDWDDHAYALINRGVDYLREQYGV